MSTRMVRFFGGPADGTIRELDSGTHTYLTLKPITFEDMFDMSPWTAVVPEVVRYEIFPSMIGSGAQHCRYVAFPSSWDTHQRSDALADFMASLWDNA